MELIMDRLQQIRQIQVTKTSKVLIFILIYLLIMFYLVNAFQGVNSDIVLAKQKHKNAQVEFEQAVAEFNNLKKVQQDLEDYKTKYEEYDPDMTLLFLLSYAKQSLQNSNLQYIEPRPLEYVQTKDHVEIPVSIKAKGSYEEFIQFFQSLRSFYPTPVIRNLSMKFEKGDLLNAAFDLVTVARNPQKETFVNSIENVAKGKIISKNPFGQYIGFEVDKQQIYQMQQSGQGVVGQLPSEMQLGPVDIPVDNPGANPGAQQSVTSQVPSQPQPKYHWPLPVAATIASGFGPRPDPFDPSVTKNHYGVDLTAETGTPVLAVAKGKVLFVGDAGDYGTAILIEHEKGEKSFYAHLSQAFVQVGQAVEAGAKIGAVGSSGKSTGPHLHFGYSINNQFVDPMSYIGTPPAN